MPFQEVGVRAVVDGFDPYMSKMGQMDKAAGGFGSALAGPVKLGAMAAGVALAGFSAAGGLVATAAIGAAAQMETYTIQFKVLLGSTDAARERIEELAKFAEKTPFELPEVVQASKLLQTFGGTALATGSTLTMVGDMAAASGAGFGEIATWVGRAYTNIQAGRPFGEAAMRLQELGLMSGETRSKLEELTKSGASSDEVWTAFTGSMGKYNGMMLDLSESFGGLTSTVSDSWTGLMRTFGEPLLEPAKIALKAIIAFLSDPAVLGGAKAIGEAIAGIGKQVIGAFSDKTAGAAQGFGAALQRIAEAIKGVDVAKFFASVSDPQGSIAKIAASLFELAKAFGGLGLSMGSVVLKLLPQLTDILVPLLDLIASNRVATYALVAAFAAWKMSSLVSSIATLVTGLITLATSEGALTAAQWLLNAAMAASPILLVVVAVAALAAGAYLLITHWEEVKEFFLKTVWPALQKFGDFLAGLFQPLLDAVKVALDWLKSNWPMVLGILLGPIGIFAGMLAADSFGLRTKLAGLLTGLLDSAKEIAGKIGGAITAAFTIVLDFLKDHWPEIAALISGPFFPIVALATDAFGIRSKLTEAFQSILEKVTKTIESLVKAFLGIPGQLVGVGTSILNTIWTEISPLPGQMIALGAQIPQMLWQGIESMKDWLLGQVGSLAGEILGKLDPRGWFDSPGLVLQGRQVPTLLWEGISSEEAWLLDKVGDLASDILHKLDPRGWFGSPDDLRDYGMTVDRMLADGIKTGAVLVQGAATLVIEDVMDELQNSFGGGRPYEAGQLLDTKVAAGIKDEIYTVVQPAAEAVVDATTDTLVDGFSAAGESVGAAAEGIGAAIEAGLVPSLQAALDLFVQFATETEATLVASIEAEKATLASLDGQLRITTANHEALSKTIDSLKVSVDYAQNALKDFGSAPLAGTQAFSDATFALSQQMDRLQLPINNVKLGLLEENKALEDGKRASEGLSSQVRALAVSIGFWEQGTHKGKLSLEDINKVLAAAGIEMNKLSISSSNVNLRENLALEPLQRQIDKMLDTSKELTFEEIIAGIRAAHGDLTTLNPLLEEANALFEKQTLDIKALEEAQKAHNQVLSDLETALKDLAPGLVDTATLLNEELGKALADVFATKGDKSAVAKAESLFAELKRVLDEGGKSDLIPALQTTMDNAMGVWEGGFQEGGEDSGGALLDGTTGEIDEQMPGAQQDIAGTIQESLAKLVNEAGQWGRAIAGYIMSGIYMGFAENFEGYAGAIAAIIYDKIKAALGIASPAKMMYSLGENAALGFMLGFNQTLKLNPVSVPIAASGGGMQAQAPAVSMPKYYGSQRSAPVLPSTFTVNIQGGPGQSTAAIGAEVRTVLKTWMRETATREPAYQ